MTKWPGVLKVTGIFILLAIVVIGGLPGCDECDDCSPDGIEPAIALAFFNYDSVRSARVSLLSVSPESTMESLDLSDTSFYSYRFPLNMQATETTYAITWELFNEQDAMVRQGNDTFRVVYDLDTVEARTGIRVSAANMAIAAHTFDSLYDCTSNNKCTSGQIRFRAFM